ncbi:hypothetical protein KFE25_014331 [Diacronema lutheri]|uniref:CS domain-containing protein n=1 Tax=Diacronema lutheri TaxID=2081491 RepID=A0A8J5X5C2_DIALT|nr:hypothetical protein KFE25_014331 [Diacronema lutheri]
MDKIEYKRLKYEHNGQTVYEWEQSLEELHCYISPPAGIKARQLSVDIHARHLTVGIKGNPPFLNEDFADFVNSNESFWTLEDGVLHLTLCKGSKGVTWPSLLKGHAPVDPFTQQEVQKSLMLERFQTENPGFDFSGASFNGQVPDPKTFMEGVRYT